MRRRPGVSAWPGVYVVPMTVLRGVKIGLERRSSRLETMPYRRRSLYIPFLGSWETFLLGFLIGGSGLGRKDQPRRQELRAHWLLCCRFLEGSRPRRPQIQQVWICPPVVLDFAMADWAFLIFPWTIWQDASVMHQGTAPLAPTQDPFLSTHYAQTVTTIGALYVNGGKLEQGLLQGLLLGFPPLPGDGSCSPPQRVSESLMYVPALDDDLSQDSSGLDPVDLWERPAQELDVREMRRRHH